MQPTKRKEKKKYQSKASLEQEFHKRIADQMAEGIRQMAAEERRANEIIRKFEADEVAAAEERRRQNRAKKRQLKLTVDDSVRSEAPGSPMSPVQIQGSPSTPLPRGLGLTAHAYRIEEQERQRREREQRRARMKPTNFLPNIFKKMLGISTESDELVDDTKKKRKKKKVKASDYLLRTGLSMGNVALSAQLHDPYISDNKRRIVASKMIQRCANYYVLEPWRRERAARVLQKNFRIYREHLLTRKFHIMMRLELRARANREAKLEEMRAKKEKHKATAALEAKKKMERIAAASGAWNKKDMKNKSKGWSKVDMARLVALNYSHGVPRDADDDAWDYYTDEFPKKKKSEISKMVNKMKASGQLNDLELFNELSPDELKRLVPKM